MHNSLTPHVRIAADSAAAVRVKKQLSGRLFGRTSGLVSGVVAAVCLSVCGLSLSADKAPDAKNTPKIASKSAQKQEQRMGTILPIGLLSLANDPRYDPSVLDKAYPQLPGGRSEPALALALDDAAFSLQNTAWTGARVEAAVADDMAALPATLAALLKKGVRHIVLELPAEGVAVVTQATATPGGQGVILVNAAAPEDSLRGAQCARHLLHTLPSHAMQADALAQLLAARKWAKPLVLHGTSAADLALLKAFTRSAKRFGLKPVAQRPFKQSNDPRERELGNVRLLTANADYDVIVVLDADGEFARDLPFRSVLPRPVLGSAGLVAQAWSPWYERNGAPQLNKRFFKLAKRPMGSYDWATWLAGRALVEAAVASAAVTAGSGNPPAAGVAAQLQLLRQGTLEFDGYKGQRLSFRAWDGQLRQPMLLMQERTMGDMVPIEGFLHAKTALDTLGFDAPETECKAP
jgi:ABC transporter substrate binding protein (PQQ-dependent alcohol dehydrogenase system)